MLNFINKLIYRKAFKLPHEVTIPRRGRSPIADLKVGQQLQALHPKSGKLSANTVKEIDRRTEKGDWYLIFCDCPNYKDGRVLLFSEQSVFANGNVTHARLLKPGDELIGMAGTPFKISKIKKIRAKHTWHKLDISGNHSYFVNDVLLHNATRFWVGGTGTWDSSATTHWSTTSGGGSGASAPGSADTANFNGSSGGGTVTIVGCPLTVGVVNANGFTGTITRQSSGCGGDGSSLDINGSLTLGSALTWDMGSVSNSRGAVTLKGTGAQTITPNSCTLAPTIIINSAGGTYTLTGSDYVTSTSRGVGLTQGTLDFNDFNVTTGSVRINDGSTKTMRLGNGTIAVSGSWFVVGTTGLTFFAEGSTIKLTTDGGQFLGAGGLTYNNVWFASGSKTTGQFINGSQTFADFKVSPNTKLFFEAGTTQTVSTIDINGTAGNLIELRSASDGSTWSISDSTGTNTVTYTDIKDSIATGGATWSAAGATNINSGNNTGWGFYNAANDTAQSLAYNTANTAMVATVDINPTESLPGSTTIDYYFQSDSGSGFVAINPASEVVLTMPALSANASHKWKAELNGNTLETPILDDLDIVYRKAMPLAATTDRLAQSFASGAGGTIAAVLLNLVKTATDTINYTVEIHPDSAGSPSGTPITNGTATILAANVPNQSSGTFAWVAATFATPPTLSASTTYWIVLKVTVAGTTSILWRARGGNSYGSGTAKFSTNSGSAYTTMTNDDFLFQVLSSAGTFSANVVVSYKKRWQ